MFKIYVIYTIGVRKVKIKFSIIFHILTCQDGIWERRTTSIRWNYIKQEQGHGIAFIFNKDKPPPLPLHGAVFFVINRRLLSYQSKAGCLIPCFVVPPVWGTFCYERHKFVPKSICSQIFAFFILMKTLSKIYSFKRILLDMLLIR